MQYNKEFSGKSGRQITTSSPRDVRRRQQSRESDTRLIEELRNQIDDLRTQFSKSTGGMTPEKVDAEIRKAVKEAVKETKDYYEPLLAKAKSKEEALRESNRELKERAASLQAKERESADKKLQELREKLEEKYNNKINSLEDKLKIAEDKLEAKSEEVARIKEEKESAIGKILDEQNKKLEELAKHISLKEVGVDDPDRPAMEETFVDPLDKDSGSDLETHIKLEDLPSKKKEAMSNKVNKLKDLMGSFADKEE